MESASAKGLSLRTLPLRTRPGFPGGSLRLRWCSCARAVVHQQLWAPPCTGGIRNGGQQPQHRRPRGRRPGGMRARHVVWRQTRLIALGAYPCSGKSRGGTLRLHGGEGGGGREGIRPHTAHVHRGGAATEIRAALVEDSQRLLIARDKRLAGKYTAGARKFRGAAALPALSHAPIQPATSSGFREDGGNVSIGPC